MIGNNINDIGDWKTINNFKYYYGQGSNETVRISDTLVVKNYARLEGTNSTFVASTGQDIVTLGASCRNDTIYTGMGNDFIGVSYGANSKIYAGTGNDTIRIRANSIYANGEAGNDQFVFVNNTSSNPSSKVTCEGGEGNDTFNFYQSSSVSISGGSGKNTYNFDPFYVAYSSPPYHNDVVITDLKDGDVIIYNRDYLKELDTDEIELTYSKDSRGNIVLKDQFYDNFSITLQGVTDISEVANVIYQGLNETKTLGEIFDVDPIPTPTPTPKPDNSKYNSSSYVRFSGSSSADSMSNTGNYVTICGGSGNDTITNSGSKIVYQYNPSTDGNDVIYGFTSNDTLQVPNSVKSYNWRNSGNDKIITISGKNVTLKNAASV